MRTSDISDATVCAAFADAGMLGIGKGADEMLRLVTGAHPKVCLRAMERAARRGLVEYGVSLRTGWLTEAGKRLLSESES